MLAACGRTCSSSTGQPAAAVRRPSVPPRPGCPAHLGSFFTCRAAANTPCQFLIDFNLRPRAAVGAEGRGSLVSGLSGRLWALG